MKSNNETFSDRLYLLRKKELALKQEAFARILGLHPITISYYENNERRPNLVFFQKIKKKWKVNLNWLISGQGDIFDQGEENRKTGNCPPGRHSKK